CSRNSRGEIVTLRRRWSSRRRRAKCSRLLAAQPSIFNLFWTHSLRTRRGFVGPLTDLSIKRRATLFRWWLPMLFPLSYNVSLNETLGGLGEKPLWGEL